jgi:uncharacterized membrane protein
VRIPSLTFTSDLVWPWSLRPWGPVFLAVVALGLTGLTLWTYYGVIRANVRRVAVILSLRLLALALACGMILRPSLAFRDSAQLPSTLLIVLDQSLSMTTQDEFGGRSRWEVLQQLLQQNDSDLKRLQDEYNISTVKYAFAEDLRTGELSGAADGKRTDFGQMLQSLYEIHGRDRSLRGLVILSDGADNGTRYPALSQAARWRSLPCPIYTFGLGQPTTSDQQSDLALVHIAAEPSPVPIKGRLKVRATLDAPGLENAATRLHLLLDDKEVLAQEVVLRKTTGNEATMTIDAPATPGERKVTLRADPLPGELSTANNEISTYVTVTKEGISVLLVDRLRFPEPQLICDALSTDPRIRLYTAWRRGEVRTPEVTDLFDFQKQHYDVILVGDVSADRITGGDPRILDTIHELVREKGAGLLMMGGYWSFGNSDWAGTPIERLLPVALDQRGQVEERVRIEPTPKGLAHYVLRLADEPEANRALWGRLPELDGMTKLAMPKQGATVLAVRAGREEPMLVGHDYGAGRVLAFAADTTWRWQRLGQPKSSEGLDAHARFWKQLVLWLAKQDEATGSVWIKPDLRRLGTGSKLGFSVGLRGTGGVAIPDGQFEVVAIDPLKAESKVPTANEKNVERGNFWKTDAPGEYRLVVRGRGKDVDGKEIRGEASARFLVYQDDSELLRRAADHDFLSKLAAAGGGEFARAQDLPNLLEKLRQAPSTDQTPKLNVWPDWRRTNLSGFLPGLLVVFVTVLCLEWVLRRLWGLV